MSSGEWRKVSCEEIQRVQNGIERCLRAYMSQKEVVETLFVRDNIEPRFTELVWQRLEEENQEFFKAYYLRLMVKAQIMEFNKLLSEQADLMGRLGQAGIASIAMANGSHASSSKDLMGRLGQAGIASIAMGNGSHASSMHQNSAGYTLRPENMQLPLSAALPSVFSPNGPSMRPSVQTAVDMSSHTRNLDAAGNMLLAQSSNRGAVQALGGGMIKSEPGYAGSLPFEFGAHNNLAEQHRAVLGDAPVSSFSSVESNSQPLNESLLDPDSSSFGYLGHMSQTFGLPELPTDFSNGTDLLESYSRASFLAPNASHFLDPHSRGESQGDATRLNTTSESLRYQDLGGD